MLIVSLMGFRVEYTPSACCSFEPSFSLERLTMNFVPLLSTIVTFVFAVAVFARWRHRRKKHLLLWGIGLVLYGLGTLCEVLLGVAFSPWILKLWYLTGAMLTAAWLGQGTVYLLVRRPRVADTLMVILAVLSLAALILVALAPVDAVAAAVYDLSRPASEQYRAILGRSGVIILLTILLNIYGTITLVGGALYSAYLFWRKRVLANRMIGNILIAAGALMPAMAGAFVRAGLVDWLYVSELLGAILMFAGFMMATAGKPTVEPKTSKLVHA